MMLKKATRFILGMLVATIALLWPAFYNGQPFFYPDTADYVNGAEAGIHRITGLSSRWTQPESSAPGAAAGKSVRAGRSIYYGILLYAGDRAGRFWPSIVTQSVLLVLAVVFTLEALGIVAWPYGGVLILVLAFLSAAPLFTSFLMPDVFAGITILACSTLIAGGLSQGRFHDYKWLALLTLSLIFHNSHILIAILILSAGTVAYVAKYAKVTKRGLLLVAIALVLSYAAAAVFNRAVTRALGAPPILPPFLSARVIADGPGYEYLRATCPGSGYAVCRFLDHLPVSTDEFLWSHDPAHGVFGAADETTRRQLSHEQWSLVLAVVRHSPWRQARAFMNDALRQLLLMGAADFQYSQEEKRAFAQELPPVYATAIQRSAAYRGTMPIGWLSFVSYLSALVGSGYIGYVLCWTRARAGDSDRVVYRLATLVVIGVIANGVICGTISDPTARFQARVAWLLPMMAMILHFRLHKDWWQSRLRLRLRNV